MATRKWPVIFHLQDHEDLIRCVSGKKYLNLDELSIMKRLVQKSIAFAKKNNIDKLNSGEIIEAPKADPRNYKTYLAFDKKSLLYKIGKATDPKGRLKALRTGNPNIELVHVIEYNCENKLHKKFKAQRSHGEWYQLFVDDVNTIKEL